MNKITRAIEKMDERLSDLSDERRAGMQSVSEIDSEEHATYQEAKSMAQVIGALNLDEANTVYSILGPTWTPSNGGWSLSATLSAKVVVTALMLEIFRARQNVRSTFEKV